MSNIVIHNNNIDSDLFEGEIPFNSKDDIDKYISEEIIPKLLENDFDRVLIKDNLSSNYLEFVGLRVAYHIRLSQELGEKRFSPIIILSDLDSHTLNKLEPMAKILFTKNIFIISNTKDEIEKFKTKKLKNLTAEEYQEKFLNLITLEAPEDYTDHHDITNEWAIHQWSNALELTTDTIDINHNKISSMLYFKYLKTLNLANDAEDQKYEVTSSKMKGKILYIDDEWNKGWSDILNSLFEKSPDAEFQTFEYNYKDTNKFTMLADIKQRLVQENPDVVILDLRLSQTDHNKIEDIEHYTGIKVLKEIKEINPGIQVIMMTATRQSVILEKLYDYGVLGYIKKEHPDDVSVHTVENIDKLFKLVEGGLKRKYLKRIWQTSQNLIDRLDNDPFKKHFKDVEDLDYLESLQILQNEARFIFDILNVKMDNKLNYALISLASSLDALKNIFIECSYNRESRKNDCYYLERFLPEKVKTLNTYILYIIERMNHKGTFKKKEKSLKRLIEARNCYIHQNPDCPKVEPGDILVWFELLNEIIEKIENPKKRKIPKQESMNTLGGLEVFKK